MVSFFEFILLNNQIDSQLLYESKLNGNNITRVVNKTLSRPSGKFPFASGN